MINKSLTTSPMEGGVTEDNNNNNNNPSSSCVVESWEVADVEETMKRLLLSNNNNNNNKTNINININIDDDDGAVAFPADNEERERNTSTGAAAAAGVISEDAISQVDQFLREALHNPRERLSILRMEQDVEKFIRDPMRQQMEFQQLPTSYLRLAAHRVAQHYFLQSMVLLDNSLPDGSGSRIIVRKTSTECRLPRVRLADIPVNLPSEDGSIVKVAIKQRPQKYSGMGGGGSSGSGKSNHAKSVEERKEEYNRARARIFNSANNNSSPGAKAEIEPKKAENVQLSSTSIPVVDNKSVPGVSDVSSGRGLLESSAGSSRSARSRVEKDPVSRYRPNSRVAIFRDREIERKDPDYDRSYDRYVQRFDPGFGFSAGPYTVQPMYAPAVNYNTEFPQLGSSHRPHVSVEPPRPLPQHLPGPWPSNPTALGYGHPETLMTAYSPNHVNARSASAIYLHSNQYPCQRPGIPFMHPHEHLHQTYAQSQQQQHDATLGIARPH